MAQTQKQEKPTDGKSDEWQQDLNPQPMAGKNSQQIYRILDFLP